MAGHGQSLRKNPLPSIEALRAKFWYCKDTGRVFTKRGQVGILNPYGYVEVAVQSGPSIKLRVHRLAFALIEGNWPDVVHHINGDKADNRWSNLSSVSQRDNLRAEKCFGKFPFGIHPSGCGFQLGFKSDGVKHMVYFTFWRDAYDFRVYLDRGFARYGEAFDPVIPPKSKRCFGSKKARR